MEGQITHPIGKCVFVFAGGTRPSMDTFSDEKNWGAEKFKRLKGPDFVSRLRGYLDVLGPNPKTIKLDGKEVPDRSDTSFPIRRAILIRALTRTKETAGMDIDFGLMNALLKARKFEHGARSLQTILDLTEKDNRGRLMRSGIPPREQMMLHVDVDEVMENIKQDQDFKLEAEKIAIAVHSYYSANLKAEREEIYANTEWGSLGEMTKADNLAAALRIPKVISLLGLRLEKKEDGGAGTSLEVEKTIKERENLEVMAKAEHDGWMSYKELNGWEYDELPEMNSWRKKTDFLERELKRAASTNEKANLEKDILATKQKTKTYKKKAESKKYHHGLVEYSALPPYMKKKDRDAVPTLIL